MQEQVIELCSSEEIYPFLKANGINEAHYEQCVIDFLDEENRTEKPWFFVTPQEAHSCPQHYRIDNRVSICEYGVVHIGTGKCRALVEIVDNVKCWEWAKARYPERVKEY